MADIKIPNTICRNKNCTKGENGERKKFYACKYCLKTENWRSFCCSRECFDEYVDAVNKARDKDISDILPERLDMTKDEILEFMEKSYDEVIEETKDELSEYIAENPDKSITEIVDIVNSDIKENSKRKRNNNKK